MHQPHEPPRHQTEGREQAVTYIRLSPPSASETTRTSKTYLKMEVGHNDMAQSLGICYTMCPMPNTELDIPQNLVSGTSRGGSQCHHLFSHKYNFSPLTLGEYFLKIGKRKLIPGVPASLEEHAT